MRILAISNLYPPDVCGGYELGCQQVVDALRACGHDVRVLTSAPRSPVAMPAPEYVMRTLHLSDMWDYYSDSQSTPVALRMKEAEALQGSAFNIHALLRALDEFAPDVAYLWMLVGVGGLGLLACLQHMRIPWVWHLMDEVPTKLCTVAFQVRPVLARALSRQALGRYLACSRQLTEQIERLGVSLGERVEMVPNWVCGPAPGPRRRFYKQGGALKIVAAAATIDRVYDKGIDLLIEACGQLRKRGYPSFSLDIYGRATDPYYAELIQRLQVSDHVKLCGSVPHDELLERFGHYDVFAFPGRVGEPNAFAPLEAMNRGCVPVLSRSGGNCEWLVHGVHCLKVERTAGGFARAFASILDGPVALEPLGQRAAAAIRRDFHLAAQMPTIERALRAAADQPRQGAGNADEAYRLALLAEKVTALLIQQPFVA